MIKISTSKKKSLHFIVMGCIALFAASCKDTPPDPKVQEENKDYGIVITVGNTGEDERYYTLTTNDLTKDTLISPVKSGIAADVSLYWSQYYSAVKDGIFYFTVDGNVISKQQIDKGKYKELGNIVAPADSWQLGMMKTVFDKNILNFISWESAYDSVENVIKKNLYIVNTDNMLVNSSNPIKFPAPQFDFLDEEGNVVSKSDIAITPTSFSIRDNKVFIGYYYQWSTKIDTAYMLVCDYPSLGNVKLLKDTRLGHVSGAWYASSSSFTDSQGDYYFTTVDVNKNFGVLRVKKGSLEIDPSYAFALSGTTIDEATFSAQYAGGDHHAYLKDGLAFIGSYVVDVHNKTIVQNLNSFGFGKVQSSMDSYVEDGKLFVILKTDDSRWYIAKYDPDKNTLTKGVQIDGGVKSVNRIYRLK